MVPREGRRHAGLHGDTPAAMSTPAFCGGGDAAAAAAAQTVRGCEQALLSSDRYASLILAQMNRMRLRSDFCDVGLRVGGRVFRVHRLVLAASSPYFSALFSGGMSEAEKDEVQIMGVDTDVFETLLDFVYTGQSAVQAMFVQVSGTAKFCSRMHFGKADMDKILQKKSHVPEMNSC